MKLRALKGAEVYVLHQLMLKEGFPHTPQCFIQAKSFLDECICYGKFNDKGCLDAAFIFGDIQKETAFLDVICQKKMRGRWLNLKVIQFIMRLAFGDLNLKYIWVQPQNKTSNKLARAFGFRLVSTTESKQSVKLILTQAMYKRSKFYKGNKNGINF